MDAREQLLQSLMRDLQSFELPERFGAEKKAQIEKGRKGQSDIDAGRAAIQENERLYQDAVTKKGELQERISKLQTEIDTASTKAKAESPYEQGRQIALFGAPAAVGLGAGYLEGRSLSHGLRERAAERAGSVRDLAGAVRSGEIPRSDAARTAQRLRLLGKTRHGVGPLMFGTTLAGVGAGQRALAPQLTDNPIGQDVIRGLGGLESGVGTGLALQQIGSMLKGLTQPSARDIAAIDTPSAPSAPAAPPPPESPPGKPAPNPGTKADLYNQAKARGLPVTTRMPKAEIESALGKALRNAAKASRKAPKALVPGAVGYGVYDALRSPAEAEDGRTSEPMSRGEAAAYGGGAALATGGTIAAGKAAGEKLSETALGRVLRNYGGKAISAVGRMSGPLMLNDLAVQAHRGIYGDGPQYLDVPERNPNRSVLTGQDSGPLPSAEALQIPEGIPSPHPDGSSPYDAAPPQQAPQDDQLAELEQVAAQDPELADMIKNFILARVGDAQMDQIPNAMASGQIASQSALMADAFRNLAQAQR